MGKIIASSFERYNGGVRIKRMYGSSTVTRFYVYREEDRNDPGKWKKVEGFGPTPGDRKTDAIRRSGLLSENPWNNTDNWILGGLLAAGAVAAIAYAVTSHTTPAFTAANTPTGG